MILSKLFKRVANEHKLESEKIGAHLNNCILYLGPEYSKTFGYAIVSCDRDLHLLMYKIFKFLSR